jgi:Ala-tRNA(Pro) deacylase
LKKLLEASGVAHEVLHHHGDHTAGQTAWDTHTPYEAFAKTVFVEVDGELAMAALPANDRLSETKLALALGARSVELASESRMGEACPDSEVGAAPPFGHLYGLPLYVSPALGANEEVTFNAGTHHDAIRMSYRDFIRLSEGQVVPVARHD